MNWKKKLKRLFTFARRDGGFTLVELVVVIAVLGILAGAGTVGYSGYVKKANMAADEMLMNDIKHAIELAYYADPNSFEAGSVVVSAEETKCGNDFLKGAMQQAFGSSWTGLKLKYNGWSSNHANIKEAIAGSSFSDGNGGIDAGLFKTVDTLASVAGSLIDRDGFDIKRYGKYAEYLEKNGINYQNDAKKAANAMVAYVAEANENTDRDALATALLNISNWTDKDGRFSFSNGLINSNTGAEPFPALTATYAMLKGFSIWVDKEMQKEDPDYDASVSDIVDGFTLDRYRDDEGRDVFVSSEADVLAAINYNMKEYGMLDTMLPFFQDYLDDEVNGAKKDLYAYFGAIDAIADNEAYIMGNLDGSEGFYSKRADYLNTYLNMTVKSGERVAIAAKNADNILEVSVIK